MISLPIIQILPQDFWMQIGMSIVLLTPILLIPYFWRKEKNQFKKITVWQMIDERKAKGAITEDEEVLNELANEYLERAFQCWSIVEKNKENEFRSPKTKKEITESLAYLEKVVQLKPTDLDVINRVNELQKVIKNQMKRSFFGSKWLLGTSIVVLIALILWFTPGEHIFEKIWKQMWLVQSIVLYYFASFAPQFLIEQKMSNQVFGHQSIFGGISNFFNQLLVTSSYSESSGCGTFFILIIIIIISVIFTFLLWLISFINFTRNYILYI